MHILKLLFFYTLALILNLGVVQGASTKKIILKRYRKAMKAYHKNNYNEAVHLLKENIKSRKFHYKSYLLLSDVFIKKNKLERAQKIIDYSYRKVFLSSFSKKKYNFIKRHNSKKNLQHFLSSFEKKPKINILKATFYTALFKYKYFPKDIKHIKEMIYLLEICKKFKYQISRTNFYLGIISSRTKDHQSAVKELLLSSEYQDENDSLGDNSKEDLKRLSTLGESLIETGHLDMGTVYLRSVYFNENARESEKETANIYLDTLSGSNYSAFLKLGLNYTDNLNELNETDIKDDETIEFLKSIDAVSTIKNAGMYYSSENYKTRSYFFSLGLKEELMQKKEINNNDSRKVSSAMSLKYNNFYKSIIKFDYNLTNSFGRENQGEDFALKYHSHSFIATVTQMQSIGTISYGLNFFYSDNKWSVDLFEKGLSLSVSPFSSNRFFHPTYSINYSNAEESITEKSHNASLSLTNFFSITKKLSTFGTLNYSYKKMKSKADSYNELLLLVNFSYKLSKHFVFDISYMPKITKSFDDQKTSRYDLSSNLKYYF